VKVWEDSGVSIEAKTAELTDRASDALTIEFQDVPTDVLLAIAAARDRIRKDGWLQIAIRDYVDAWRNA
jgi:hypothetical protein